MRWMRVRVLPLAAIAVLAAAEIAAAAITPINDIMIDVRDPCMAPPMAVNLGDLSIDLNYNAMDSTAEMTATFTVDDAVDGMDSTLWHWLDLHFLQTIWLDSDPNRPEIAGVKPNLPVVDPPKGGWDYMYLDGAMRMMPDDAGPNFGYFIDDEPWYYNETGEDAEFEECEEYVINDVPSIGNGVSVGFSTYLAAEAKNTFCDEGYCLQAGQILILAGFDWLVNGTAQTATVTDTFYTPSPFDVADITAALTNGGFSGWTVVDDKDICCPEPGSLLLVLIGVGGFVSQSRRRAA
jgi:hypothetical protein